ncbi:MAG: bacterial Ig-like domain-containing protein, partial [Sodaliphilus sp.]|nr:bacterial Ig-like domain-containing protein [Sodaliphilus sp.]
MRKIFTLLIVAILATATSWAAEYTITFGNKATQPTELLASVKASTAITGGLDYVTAKPFTENLGKSYYGDDKSSIRVGKSKNAATLSIALSESGQVKASSIVVNCKQMSDNNAGTLAVNGLTAQKFPSSASDLTYTFSEPTDIASIQLKATKSVYVYSITVTYTDSPEPQKTVKSLAITGEPTNKEYYVGDAFSTDGLKVNATYDDATQEDVT